MSQEAMTMTDDVHFTLEILPSLGGTAKLLRVPIGAHAKPTVLLTVDVDENDDQVVQIIAGGPESTVEGIGDLVDMLEYAVELLRNPQFVEAWAAQIAERNAADAAEDSGSGYYGDDVDGL